MTTNYPGAVDSLTNPAAGDALNSPSHAAQHANANDAIEAVQTELGANPSGSEATVVARLEKIEDGTRLAANSVGATQIANDSVDTAAIQSKAVTAAKIADDTITAAQIATNAVGASELADNAVDTAAIADGAATPAKLATTGRFVFPTGAANGYGFASGAVHLSGTGAPEGAVTAPPGSTWLQIGDAITVSGNLSWRKATGTGNTGWIAEGALADTGWRSLDATAFGVDTGKLTLSKCHLRRVGPQVFLSFYGTKVGTSGTTIAAVPAGFRPADADDTYAQIRNFTSKLDAGLSNVNTVGQINWDSAGLTGGNVYIVTCTFAVTTAWPASLPGSAA